MTDAELLAALADQPCLQAAVERIMGERTEAEQILWLVRKLTRETAARLANEYFERRTEER